MIIADTSVWIDHLRATNAALGAALEETRVLMHPFIVGELACGNARNRAVILRLLTSLPAAIVATDDEALAFIEVHGLAGAGLGFVDVHLLASASLSGARLWTLDKRLAATAKALGL